jgi:hypothetical protein
MMSEEASEERNVTATEIEGTETLNASTEGPRRSVRRRIFEALKRELMGPTTLDERIKEYPTSRYIVGRLAPAQEDTSDQDAAIDSTENDSFDAGADDDEAGPAESQAPLIVGFSPSSMGLSFLVDGGVDGLKVKVAWGDYKREKIEGEEEEEEEGTIWQRYHREGEILDVPIGSAGSIPRIPLSQSQAPAGITINGIDDPEITLEGVVHEVDGWRAVSLFLVNRRTKGELKDRTKDERWVMQPRIDVEALDGSPIFVAKDSSEDRILAENEAEIASYNLIYRHAYEFTTGHGVATGWVVPEKGASRATKVFTDFMPDHEVPNLIAPADSVKKAGLDMKALGHATNPVEIEKALEPLLEAYEGWVSDRKKDAAKPEIAGDPKLKEVADENLKTCDEALVRMRAGLQLIGANQEAFQAFRFANKVMWDQRIHSKWAKGNAKRGEIEGAASDFDEVENRTWRPFQMGFILLNLRGIADPISPEGRADRESVDLLWFPTGGGKTEAYLGLAAFTLALRRLRGDQDGLISSAGVSVIMRYTLRLLTVQQFQRASALIVACEIERESDDRLWGKERFTIGLWVGRKTTPNYATDSEKALERIKSRKRPKEGSPIQLVTCPRCGDHLVNEYGRPKRQTYEFDGKSKRTIISCANAICEFSRKNSGNQGLPVTVIDDELYTVCPSLLIATVDKFARLPFKGETQALFGKRNRFSSIYGHLTEAHKMVRGRAPKDAIPAFPFLPPDLIIQDELHLISGPLGTMVGLYESAVDALCRRKLDPETSISAKIIASTATIRRAAEQGRHLYNRKLSIFPPSGLSARDSFFAREREIDPAEDGTAGRLYVGVNAPGSSTKTLLVRVYAALLAAAQAEMIDTDPKLADPYGTLVGYFNSLKALGGAKRLVEDDVKLRRLPYLAKQRGFPKRRIADPDELTSRLVSWRIPTLLKRLENEFPRSKENWPIDVLIATNMISVGVDIDRLGLMVVTGQPRSTSEYIQATSRVGRQHPGLVVTMYNWLGARDISHYERFRSYHEAFYRYVEAISVTPFSSRAIDRGLRGVFVGLRRLEGKVMSQERHAENFDPNDPVTKEIIEGLKSRASSIAGKGAGDLVQDFLKGDSDDWATYAAEPLRYCYLMYGRPKDGEQVLIRTMGTAHPGKWWVPGSLREVEQEAAFFIAEDVNE